jgi:hypothetical protein
MLRHSSPQHGITIPLLAMFIVVLFAVAALAIDVGVLYTARSSAQHAADAAALAGAFTFLDVKNVQPETAINAAIAAAETNEILGQRVTISASNVGVDVANRRVSVTVPRTGVGGISTFFARAIGVNSVDVRTQATAEASKNATGTHCLKPIILANTALSEHSSEAACAAGETIFDRDGNVTTFAVDRFGRSAVELRPAGHDEDDHHANKYLPLDFGGDHDSYIATFHYCLNDPECGADLATYSCSTHLTVRDHLDPRETFLGVEELLGHTPDRWGGPSPSGGFQYLLAGHDGAAADTSLALGVVAVWDNCSSPVGHSLQPVGFAQLFFEGADEDDGDITARVVGAHACGSYTRDDSTGPYAVPVRLVQRPPAD